MKIAILYQGPFGQKFIRHLKNVEGFCTGCTDCNECRKQYNLDYSQDIAYTWEQPENLPSMLDDVEPYLPPVESLAGVHTVVAINLHQDILLSLPGRLAEAGVRVLLVPLEDGLWLQSGARRQVEQAARAAELEVSFPKPFCSLEESEAFPEISRFMHHFRIGYPRFRIKKLEGIIQEAEVLRSSPCGCAYFVARSLANVRDDEKLSEYVGQKWHAYPCTGSMKVDRELKDTILHAAGHIHREAVAAAALLADDRQRSADPAVQAMLALPQPCSTAYDRYLAQQPQCKSGDEGLCCRICIQGPCRISAAAPKGVCGASAYTVVARNLLRSVLSGAAAHADHAKHILLAARDVAQGSAASYQVADRNKLYALAEKFGVNTEGRQDLEILGALANLGLEDYMRLWGGSLRWVEKTVTPGRAGKFLETDIMPTGIFDTIATAASQTHMGMDADPVSLVFKTLEAALADYAGMHLGTDFSDVLFGAPVPVASEANLGIIDPARVNIALHGHNPLLSEMVVSAAAEMEGEARSAGAAGIQLLGVCCTGNEVLMRQGVPLATNVISQELPIMTGALDCMVVDVQCIMPSIQSVAACFKTRIVTTAKNARIPGSHYIDFSLEEGREKAREIIRLAIKAYQERAGSASFVPPVKSKVVAGFSLEALFALFSALEPEKPVKVLTTAIERGELRGVLLFAGCNNLKGTQDYNYLTIARELAKENVFMIATGCAAGAFAKLGLLTPAAVDLYAGDGLKAFLTRLQAANGQAAALGLPLVFHMGSCVDNTRAADLATAMALEMGVDLPKIPFAASAPEAMTEKSLSIGSWNVAMGLPVHVGVVPPVSGSDLLNGLLLQIARDVFGGYFIWETDPQQAAVKILDALDRRSWKLRIHREAAEKYGTALAAAW